MTVTKAIAEPQRQRAGPSTATIERRLAVAEGAAITEILRLQRSAGNSAVIALLAGKRGGSRPSAEAKRAASRVGTGEPVAVQRAAFGLIKKDQVSGFAGLALDLWTANKDMSLEDFNKRLMDELNSTLVANGVPQLPPPSFGPTPHAAGGFAAKTWTVVLDPAKTAGRPLRTKIGDLTADQIAELAGICYHEARHAEQAFLVARLVVSETNGKKDPNAIATALDIPVPVADAAIKSQVPLPAKKDLPMVEQWREFSPSGKHRDYRDWNETFKGFVENVIASFESPPPKAVNTVTEAWQKLSPTIASWRKNSLTFVDNKITELQKAKTRSSSDQQVQRDLQKIRAGGQKVIRADKALADKVASYRRRKAEPLTESDIKILRLDFEVGWLDVMVAVRELGEVTNQAYMNYPDEADAYAAEHAVMKEFQAKAKSTKAPP